MHLLLRVPHAMQAPTGAPPDVWRQLISKVVANIDDYVPQPYDNTSDGGDALRTLASAVGLLVRQVHDMEEQHEQQGVAMQKSAQRQVELQHRLSTAEQGVSDQQQLFQASQAQVALLQAEVARMQESQQAQQRLQAQLVAMQHEMRAMQLAIGKAMQDK